MTIKLYFAETEKKLDAAVKAGLTAVGITITYQAQEPGFTPVDTGRLRDSINYHVKGNQVKIGTPVEYAPYVEYGTRYQPAQSYLRKAFDMTKLQIVNIFMAQFKRVLK